MKIQVMGLVWALASGLATMWAQSPAEQTLCTSLRESGRVTIQQDSRLEALLTRDHKVYTAAGHRHMPTAGHYTLRAYAGNNQQASRNEAQQIERELKEYAPELETFLIFDTPFWRLWVGDYDTMEEAVAQLRDLKKHFPVYGKEMMVKKVDE